MATRLPAQMLCLPVAPPAVNDCYLLHTPRLWWTASARPLSRAHVWWHWHSSSSGATGTGDNSRGNTSPLSSALYPSQHNQPSSLCQLISSSRGMQAVQSGPLTTPAQEGHLKGQQALGALQALVMMGTAAAVVSWCGQ
jgi:hypothetical protein